MDTGDKRIEQFIIYRWNRVYPADVSVEIGTEWKLTETEEFPGFHMKNYKRSLLQRVEGEKAERTEFCKSKVMEKKSGILNWTIK